MMMWLAHTLHVLAYLVPLCVLAWRWWRQRGCVFDHVALFTIGFVFYFVMPITFGYTMYYRDYLNYKMWERLFLSVSDQRWVIYFVSALAFYGALVCGSVLGARRGKGNTRQSWDCDPKVQTYVLSAVLAVGLMGVVVYGDALRSYFFQGYRQSTQFSALGSMTAATVLLLSVAIYATAVRLTRGDVTRPWWRAFMNPFVAAFILAEGLLLSMGGRLVAVTSVLMALTLYSAYVRRLRLHTTLLVLVGLIAASHAILLFREGTTSLVLLLREGTSQLGVYGSRSVGLYFFSENFNIAFSLLDFLSNYPMPLLRFPMQLVSGLVSVVPSFIFPGKTNFIIRPLEFNVASPEGGLHAFVALAVGFGILGAIAFMFALGYGLQRLRMHSAAWAITAYVACSGWLAMMFFRDVQQALIKTMLEFSVLVPLAIAGVCVVVSRRIRQRPRA